MQYSFETIPYTEKYVLKELISKFPDIMILSQKPGEIITDSTIINIDDFYALYSPLRVTSGKTTRNLFRREWKVSSVPAGINPALAYILCQIADIQSHGIILDPFCGGGTIPITASLYFNAKKVIASDLSGKAIDISTENFIASSLSKKQYMLLRSNISMLKFPKNYFDHIITNLPFGIRVGDHEQNIKIYKIFATKAQSLLKPNGTAVILTQEKNLLLECFAATQLKLIDHFMIRQGGLTPWVFVYRKG